MQPITPQQLDILWHTLGLNAQVREPYRNFYHAGPGHYANPLLLELTGAGYMAVINTPGFLDADSVVYAVTDAGRAVAIAHLPEIRQPSRYDEYLRSDYGHSFSDFLGITLPKLEYGPRDTYRFVRTKMRRDYSIEVISGDWCTTIKAAKASYKAQLKQTKLAEKAQEASWAFG